jgi:hypothetical protein
MTSEIPPRRSNPAPARPPHLSIMEALRLYNTQSVAIEDAHTISIGEADTVRIAARTYHEATGDAAGANAMQRYADAIEDTAAALRVRRRAMHASSLQASLAELWPLRMEPTS